MGSLWASYHVKIKAKDDDTDLPDILSYHHDVEVLIGFSAWHAALALGHYHRTGDSR